jgi:hypothetical protein
VENILVTIKFRVSKDENDININTDDFCELMEKSLVEGLMENELYLDEIIEIRKDEEHE